MSTLRKTLASTAAATVLLGGSLAGPAAAGGNGHEYERNGDSNKYKVYCEEDEKTYWSWSAYDKYCDDEHDEDDGKWYFHKGVWYWHAFDEDKDDGEWRYRDGHGWKDHHDHDDDDKRWEDKNDDDDKRWEDKNDDDDDDDERDGKKRYAKHHDR